MNKSKMPALCVLAAATLMLGACAMPQANGDASAEPMEQVYVTGSSIPRKQPVGSRDAVSVQNREDAERVLSSPTLPPLPIPGGR